MVVEEWRTLVWLPFLFGLLFGSFLNVVGYRVPRGESVVWPGSHCTSCQKPLKPYELIPVVSWMLQGGRCRACKAPISVRYPCIELSCAALFAATWLKEASILHFLVSCVFWMLLLAVTATDITAMRVPNRLSIPGAVIILILTIATGMNSWEVALLGACTGFVVLLAIHLLSGGKMGMGDVKLYLSIGAMLGPLLSVESLLLSSIAGSVFGLLMRMTGLLKKREYMPFVPFITVGVIVTFFYGAELIRWYTGMVLGMSN